MKRLKELMKTAKECNGNREQHFIFSSCLIEISEILHKEQVKHDNWMRELHEKTFIAWDFDKEKELKK